MSGIESKVPELISGILSLFSSNPTIGAIVCVVVVGAIAGLSFWFNSIKNDASHHETEGKRQQDLTNIVKEGLRKSGHPIIIR